MGMSLLKWTLAWAITVIQAPVVFGVLMSAVTIANALFVEPLPAGGFGPGLLVLILAVGIFGFIPMLVFGIPTAIVLERSGFTSFVAYGIGGTCSGFIAATAMVFIRDVQIARPNADLEFALLAAAYGCVAALTFRWVSGPRNLTPPGDAGYQPPS